jgi:hypothetical protein
VSSCSDFLGGAGGPGEGGPGGGSGGIWECGSSINGAGANGTPGQGGAGGNGDILNGAGGGGGGGGYAGGGGGAPAGPDIGGSGGGGGSSFGPYGTSYSSRHGAEVVISWVGAVPTTLVAAPQVVLFPPPNAVGLFNVAATLTSGGLGVSSEPIVFSVGGSQLCSAVTDASGNASCNPGALGELEVLLTGGYTASFAGDGGFLPSTGTTPAIELGNGFLQLARSTTRRDTTIVHGTLTRGRVVYATVTSRTEHGVTELVLKPVRRLRADRYTLSLTVTGSNLRIRRTLTLK